MLLIWYSVLPWWLREKESAYKAGDMVQSLGGENPLEKEMSTHSSVLVWNTPWPEEPGGLQSVGRQRVGRD